jgi:hypothetical protein
VHVVWLEVLVRDRIAGLHRAADRARLRQIAKRPGHRGARPAAASAQLLGGHPRPAGANAPVAGPLEVASRHGQPGGADPCGQRRLEASMHYEIRASH